MSGGSSNNRSTPFLSSTRKCRYMDLTFVLGELRSELQTIEEAIISLEKLAEVRKRRTSAQDNPPPDSHSPKAFKGKRGSSGERVSPDSRN